VLLLASLTIGAPALSLAQEADGPPSAADPVEPTAVDPGLPTDAAPEPEQTAVPSEPPDQTAAESGAAGQAAPAPVPETAAAPAPTALRSRVASGKNAAAAASLTVSTGDNFYSPASVSISVGDTITWKNSGAAQHSATAEDGSFDTGIFGPGQSRSQSFDAAGTFSYFCTVHGTSQSGTVRVLAAGGGQGGGSASSGPSEAAAVAAPDAAGTGTSLPATGLPLLLLSGVGAALLGSGIAAARAAGSE
jgi:plastocyanin